MRPELRCVVFRMSSLVLLVSLVGGCFYLPGERQEGTAMDMPDEYLADFAYVPHIAGYTTQIIKQTDDYTQRRHTFASSVNLLAEHDIVIDHFAPHAAKPAPAVFVLPILGGKNKVANFFAKHFAEKGFAALVVHRQEAYKDVEEVEKMNPLFRQIVFDHKQALDWAELQADIDTSRVGLFGVSAGAIKGTLVYALDDRVDAAMLCLVGGDLPDILSYSTEKGIAKRRDRLLAERGATQLEMYAAMKLEFEHDPLKYAPFVKSDKTLLLLAAFDSVVPYKNGLALRDAMGKPPTYVIPTGHITSVVYMPWLRGVAVDHFRKHLQPDSPR